MNLFDSNVSFGIREDQTQKNGGYLCTICISNGSSMNELLGETSYNSSLNCLDIWCRLFELEGAHVSVSYVRE